MEDEGSSLAVAGAFLLPTALPHHMVKFPKHPPSEATQVAAARTSPTIFQWIVK